MKKSLVVSSALAALVASAAYALSADLPSYGDPVRPPPQIGLPPVFTWTGLYVGFNVGAGLADRSLSTIDSDGLGDVATSSTSLTGSGVVGGGQVGYNYEFNGLRPFGGSGGVVAGLEGDFDGSSYRASATTFSGLTGVSTNVSSGIDHIGSVRGRLGLAFDRAFAYGTGGFAFGRTTAGASDGFGNTYHRSAERIGYAVGGGIEYMVTQNIGVRGEYLYYDLFRRSDRYSNDFGGESVSKTHNILNTVRVGMDYKFGTGASGPFGALPGIGSIPGAHSLGF